MTNTDVWILPEELDQPFPRLTKASGKYFTALISISFLFGIPAIVMLLAAWGGTNKIGELKTRGIAVEGVVTFAGADYRRDKSPAVYDFDYRFIPLILPNGREFIRIRGSLPGNSLPRLITGQRVPVIYDPLNPDNAVLNFDDWVYNKPYSGERSFLTVVLLVCVVPYVATVLYFTSRFYREHQLLKYGHAAPAEIIGDTEKRDGGGASLSITYRFTDSHGRIVEGLRKDPPYPLLESIRAKSTVIYDPQNSSKNLLYPPDYAACAPPKA